MLTAVIIQARMASTRLPGKVLMDVKGKPMLFRVIERIRHSKLNQKIIIATSTNKEDDAVYQFALKEKIDVFRGSQTDVLNRYYEAALTFNVDIIVRITADCPLIDPFVVDKVIHAFLTNNKTIVTNAGIDNNMRTYPRGLDVEVFSFNSLLKANNNANENYQREHVTPYFYKNVNEVMVVLNDVDLSNNRWTVDTPEDLDFIRQLYFGFDNDFQMLHHENLISYINENPHLKKINEHVIQKSHLETEK